MTKASEVRSASQRTNSAIVYQGKIVDPKGKVLNGTDVPVTIKITAPEPNLCILWSERQNVRVINGGFSIEIGYDYNRFPDVTGGAAKTFGQVFLNNPGLTFSAALCSSDSNYVPTTSDDRLLSAVFDFGDKQVTIPPMPIKSVPFAMQAQEIGGYGLLNLMKISDSGSAITFSPEETTSLKNLLGGNLIWNAQLRRISNVEDPVDPADAANKSWVEAQIGAIGGGGGGSVTSVGVGGLPLSVVNSSSSPVISIAQANSTTAGYLSAADWALFNSKQPAGSYLTSITSADVTNALGYTPIASSSSSQVTSALGYTPVSDSLPSGQVYLGNGSNVAVASWFGIGQMRNNIGTAQFPTSCAASQTLTWSAVTDVLSCTNIAISAAAVTGLGGLADNNAVDLSSAEATGTLPVSKGGTGSATALNNNRVMMSSGGNIVEAAAISANSALVSNASGIPIASATVSATELGYLDGVTSAIQTQLDSKLANFSSLTGANIISALTYTPVNRAGDTMTGVLNLPTNGLAVGTNQLVVSGGNVGIGTSSPMAMFHVGSGADAATYPSTRLLVTQAGNTGISVRDSTNDAEIFVWAGDLTGGGSYGTKIGSTTNHPLSIHTNSTERVRVDIAGNVGIGTTSPSRLLEVAGGAIFGQVHITNTNANGEAGLLFKSADDIANQGWLIGKNLQLTDDTFSIYRSATSTTGILNITTAGNVGIGTTSPSAKLEVASGTAGTSGLKFTNMNSSSATTNGQPVGVDSNGNLVPIALSGVAFPLHGSAGTLTSPTYSFSSSPNSGMYNPSGSWVDLVSNGTSALRVIRVCPHLTV